MGKRISDHRFLFPFTLVSFFIAPYVADFLHIPHSYKYPNLWMWGLLFFALGAYFIGTKIQDYSSLIKRNNQITKFFIIGILFILLCLLFLYYELPFTLAFVSAAVSVIVIHYTLTPRFTDRYSFILIVLSLSLILASFVVLGGIPILNWDHLRRRAVLSPIREVALPLFLLGATFLSIKARNIKLSVGRHGVALGLFLVGFTVFLLNGKRTDAATMLFAYTIYFLRTYPSKVTIPTIILTSGIGLSAIYFQPSILGLFRQNFNFQVLRHIICYVQHPLSGETHGAITSRVNQQFLGPRLLYGEGEDWTLTSTLLGPGYLDFGLLGVLITMIGIAVILQFLQDKANRSKGNEKFEVIYIVTLAVMLSLFEEGLHLFAVIFLFAMLYGVISERESNHISSKVESLNTNFNVKTKRTIVLIALVLLGLLIIAYSFEAEFHSYKTIAETEIKQGINVLNANLSSRYYHIEISGGETAGALRGELNITKSGRTVQRFRIDGLFWIAKYDSVDVGWFKPEEAGDYMMTIFLEQIPQSPKATIIKIKESPLSSFLPTYAMLEIGATLIIASLFSLCLFSTIQLVRSRS